MSVEPSNGECNFVQFPSAFGKTRPKHERSRRNLQRATFVRDSLALRVGPCATPRRSREDRILARFDLRAPDNVVRFRGSLMVAAGALITTKYGPISPPGAVGSFRGFQPAGILSEERPPFFRQPFCRASAHVVMGVAMKVGTRIELDFRQSSVARRGSPMGSLPASRWSRRFSLFFFFSFSFQSPRCFLLIYLPPNLPIPVNWAAQEALNTSWVCPEQRLYEV